jgi:hypothetical protein
MAQVPMINLPQMTPVSQIASRVAQGNLASLQGDALQQQNQQRAQEFQRSQSLNALKQQGLTDPKARAIASQLDPDYGKKLQAYETAQQDYETKKTVFWGSQAQAALNQPLANRPTTYNNLYNKAKNAGEDVSTYPLPSEKWTDAHQNTLSNISQSSISAKNQLEMKQKQEAEKQKLQRGVGLPSDVRSYQFYKGLPSGEQQDFLNVKRDVYKTGLTTDEQGSVVPMPGITGAKTDIKAAESKGTAIGKTQGELEASLASQESKLPELEATVRDLSKLGAKATYTKAGVLKDDALRQAGLPMSKGGIARAEYISRVDNQILPLLRDTFGAAFTEREGQTLRATLGDPSATPREKDAKLKAFIEQKKASVRSTKRQLGKQETSNNDPLGIR